MSAEVILVLKREDLLLHRAEELSEAAKLAEVCGDAAVARKLRHRCAWVYRNAIGAGVKVAEDA